MKNIVGGMTDTSIWRILAAICASVIFVPFSIYAVYEAVQSRRLKQRLRDKGVRIRLLLLSGQGYIQEPVNHGAGQLLLLSGQGYIKNLSTIEQVVLITGASSGLGEALAHAFYQAGCRVVLAARREDELQRVKNALLTNHNTKVTYPPVVLPLDLSDLNALPEKITKVLDIFGHIDILINNGGISYRGNVLTTSVDVDIKLMLVNYFGQVALTKAVLPSMIQKQSGHIVAISSVQGKIAIPYRSAYAASKHALQAFCDTLRSEVASHNINVTVVSPGYIQTKLSLNALTGSGQTYGVMDATTESGSPADKVAEDILHAVAAEKKELIPCPLTPRIAILLRTLCPDLYFWLMKRRAKHH